MKTRLLCIMRELAGGGYVAVAVGVNGSVLSKIKIPIKKKTLPTHN